MNNWEKEKKRFGFASPPTDGLAASFHPESWSRAGPWTGISGTDCVLTSVMVFFPFPRPEFVGSDYTFMALSLFAKLLIMDRDSWNLELPVSATSEMSWLTAMMIWGRENKENTAGTNENMAQDAPLKTTESCWKHLFSSMVNILKLWAFVRWGYVMLPAGACVGRSSSWCTRSCSASAGRAAQTPRTSESPAWRRSTWAPRSRAPHTALRGPWRAPTGTAKHWC